MNYSDHITVTPDIRGGKPCIRGTRITVYDILEYMAGDMTEAEILHDFPLLKPEDLKAVLAFAAARAPPGNVASRMKLLLDENLSPLLVGLLADVFPGSIDVCSALGKMPTDTQIWKFARDNAFVIVSKDNDFRQRSFLYGAPPKVVWLSVGNAGTAIISRLLRERQGELIAFDADAEASLLVLGLQ